jgi:hypothetical protein
LVEGILIGITLHRNRRVDPRHPLPYGKFELLLTGRAVHIEFQLDARSPKLRCDSAQRTHSQSDRQLSLREVDIRNRNLNTQMIRDANFVRQVQRSLPLFVNNSLKRHEIGGEEGHCNQDA